MLGPLPLLHRVVLVVAAMSVWMGLGLWSGIVPGVPVSVGPGLVMGAIAGLASAYVLLHDFEHRSSLSPGRGRRRAH